MIKYSTILAVVLIALFACARKSEPFEREALETKPQQGDVCDKIRAKRETSGCYTVYCMPYYDLYKEAGCSARDEVASRRRQLDENAEFKRFRESILSETIVPQEGDTEASLQFTADARDLKVVAKESDAWPADQTPTILIIYDENDHSALEFNSDAGTIKLPQGEKIAGEAIRRALFIQSGRNVALEKKWYEDYAMFEGVLKEKVACESELRAVLK